MSSSKRGTLNTTDANERGSRLIGQTSTVVEAEAEVVVPLA